MRHTELYVYFLRSPQLCITRNSGTQLWSVHKGPKCALFFLYSLGEAIITEMCVPILPHTHYAKCWQRGTRNKSWQGLLVCAAGRWGQPAEIQHNDLHRIQCPDTRLLSCYHQIKHRCSIGLDARMVWGNTVAWVWTSITAKKISFDAVGWHGYQSKQVFVPSNVLRIVR